MSFHSKPHVAFEFEVEKVVGISADGRYQVQWAPAWVSKFHLVGCEHLIQEFLREQQAANEIDSENQPELSDVASFNGDEQEQQVLEEQHQQGKYQTCSEMSPESEIQVEIKDERNQAEGNDEAVQSYTTDLPFSTSHSPPVCAVHVKEEHNDETYISTKQHHVHKDITPDKLQYKERHQNDTYGNHSDDPSASSSNHHHNQPQFSRIQENNSSFGRVKINTVDRTVGGKPELSDAYKLQTDSLHPSYRGKPRELYSCEHCEYSSKWKNNLMKHMRTHTGERPFACNVCGRSFSLKHHMRKHAKKCSVT